MISTHLQQSHPIIKQALPAIKRTLFIIGIIS